jgi:tetratricopeptide (TPR) repeat protein
MKEFTQAVKAYRKACELKPNNFEANLKTAQCLYEVNDYNQAILYGKKAEKIDANAEELHQLLGNIYDSQKNYEQAVRSYKRALRWTATTPG